MTLDQMLATLKGDPDWIFITNTFNRSIPPARKEKFNECLDRVLWKVFRADPNSIVKEDLSDPADESTGESPIESVAGVGPPKDENKGTEG
jgi:hypothetical protein